MSSTLKLWPQFPVVVRVHLVNFKDIEYGTAMRMEGLTVPVMCWTR
jgi:hypothetical protein